MYVFDAINTFFNTVFFILCLKRRKNQESEFCSYFYRFLNGLSNRKADWGRERTDSAPHWFSQALSDCHVQSRGKIPMLFTSCSYISSLVKLWNSHTAVFLIYLCEHTVINCLFAPKLLTCSSTSFLIFNSVYRKHIAAALTVKQ